MGTKGLQPLWARSSDVLAILGEDHKASPNFFSTTYILGEFEVPTTAPQPARLIPGTLPLGKKPWDGGRSESNTCGPELQSVLKCSASLKQLLLYCLCRD